MAQHLAAISSSKGSPLEIVNRPTPTPGPDELLIEVKSIAFNPVDYYQRDIGLFVASYPSVFGSDIGGIVVSAGSSVGADAPKPGTRVAAFATCFYKKGAPDYGAFQERVLVPAANVTPLPQDMSFKEASLLPMAVTTAWAGFYAIGVARDTAYTPADKKGILIWGGASSIGSTTIQVAKLMGFRIYTTASEKHHEYLKSLGAAATFDYKLDDVVERIVKAAKADGVTIQTVYDAVGQTQLCLDVLKEFQAETGGAKFASAVPINAETPTMDGVEIKFVQPPSEEKARTEHFHFVFRVWLKEKLATGQLVPSPKIRLVDGGLPAADKALDALKKGNSGTKVVIEL